MLVRREWMLFALAILFPLKKGARNPLLLAPFSSPARAERWAPTILSNPKSAQNPRQRAAFGPNLMPAITLIIEPNPTSR